MKFSEHINELKPPNHILYLNTLNNLRASFMISLLSLGLTQILSSICFTKSHANTTFYFEFLPFFFNDMRLVATIILCTLDTLSNEHNSL